MAAALNTGQICPDRDTVDDILDIMGGNMTQFQKKSFFTSVLQRDFQIMLSSRDREGIKFEGSQISIVSQCPGPLMSCPPTPIYLLDKRRLSIIAASGKD